jgi:hypothetical protein
VKLSEPKISRESNLHLGTNNIGFSTPAGQFDFEFLIAGKKVPDALNKILSIFVEHGANLLTLSNSSDRDERRFTLSLSCNLEHSDLGPMGFNSMLRKLGFVSAVDYGEMDGRLFGRAFPLTFYDKQRVVALGSGTLIRLGMRLAKETGSTGTSSLYEEGRLYAKDVLEELKVILSSPEDQSGQGQARFASYALSEAQPQSMKIQAYCVKCKEMREIERPSEVILKNGKQAMQGACPVCTTKVYKMGSVKSAKILSSPLIENMQGFLIASGLGTFELRRETEGRAGSVTILDPPTLDEDISQGNQFVEGVAAGFLEAILGARNEMRLVGQKYLSKNKVLELHFAEYVPALVAKEIPPKPIEVKKRVTRKSTRSEIQVPQIEQISSLPSPEEYQEVDRIIHSLEQIEAQTKESMLEKTIEEKNLKEEEPQQILVEENTSTAQSPE